MFEIIMANFGFWFNFLIPIVIIFYLVLTNREYIWKEFAIQVVATLAYVSIIYSLLFSYTTNLSDENYYNGSVKSATYYEAWTELVHYTETYSCGSYKHPKTCTRQKTKREYHPEHFELLTSLGEKINISRRDYNKCKQEFGDTFKSIFRPDKVSFGDGNKYISYPNKIIPTSVAHSYINYIAAANENVIHTKVPKSEVLKLIKEGKIRKYPTLYKGTYGETELTRIIDTTGKIKDYTNLLKELNKLSVKVGKTKQANPIIYITNEDRSFKDALSQAWDMGKKNDIILILGVNDKEVIKWSDVICFTDNTDFIVDMQNDFIDKKVNKKVIDILDKNIIKSYIRKPMKDFEYLKENITLEWYWQVLIFLGNLVINCFITYKFMTNSAKKYKGL